VQEEIGIKLTVVSTGPYKGLGADGKVTDSWFPTCSGRSTT
jgi:hypothetical protein